MLLFLPNPVTSDKSNEVITTSSAKKVQKEHQEKVKIQSIFYSKYIENGIIAP